MSKSSRIISAISFDLNLTVGSKRKNDLLVLGFFTEKGKKPINCRSCFICEKTNTISLISEEKKVYVCLGDKKKFDEKHLLKVAELLTTLVEYNVDFDLSSFVTNKITESLVLEVFACFWYQYFHHFLSHKTETETKSIPSFHLLSAQEQTPQLLEKTRIIFEAVSFCRNLQDEAPNLLNSEVFADKIENHFANNKHLECQILDYKKIKKEKMNLLLAVNAGSQFEPRVVILKYFGNLKNKEAVTVLLGKGITFDTGGYSLKPPAYQIGMKFDMSGAAVVFAVLQAISHLKLKVNVIAIGCLTDNALANKPTLVESVVQSKDGKTVEITNTDAEGRLVLADGITYALEHFQPAQLIELSTLTGSVLVTLGNWMTGAFVNSHGEGLYTDFKYAADKVREPVWRLPVTSENTAMMKSKIADLVNASKEYKGGSSNAAAFLFEFIPKTPFIHLDIAGTATKPDNQLGTGVMVQTLVQYFEDFEIKK